MLKLISTYQNFDFLFQVASAAKETDWTALATEVSELRAVKNLLEAEASELRANKNLLEAEASELRAIKDQLEAEASLLREANDHLKAENSELKKRHTLEMNKAKSEFRAAQERAVQEQALASDNASLAQSLMEIEALKDNKVEVSSEICFSPTCKLCIKYSLFTQTTVHNKWHNFRSSQYPTFQ